MKHKRIPQFAAMACIATFSAMVLAGCTQPENNAVQAPVQAPMEAPVSDAPVQNQNAPSASTATQPLDADQAEDLIEDALKGDSALKFFDLDADDEGNTVILKGKVQTKAQKDSAEAIAKRTAPGITIVNRITVG